MNLRYGDTFLEGSRENIRFDLEEFLLIPPVVHTPQLTFHDLELNIQAAGFAANWLLIFLTFRLGLLGECEVLSPSLIKLILIIIMPYYM